MKKIRFTLLWLITLVLVSACAQIVGIEDPKHEIERATSGATSSGSSTGSSSASSGGTSGTVPGPWVAWPMPNPTSAGLPNPSNYTEDTNKEIVVDNVTKLMWQRTVNGGVHTQDSAKTYCNDLVHAGYNDWRLPWRIELISLVDYTKENPAIDNVFPGTPLSPFWSASADAEGGFRAWVVMFDNGDVTSDDMNANHYVRCVR